MNVECIIKIIIYVKGILWSIANFCYFLATNGLSQAITFPITNCGPSTVAFFIALIYKEVKGLRNYLLIFSGIVVAIIGSVFCVVILLNMNLPIN